MNKFFATVVTLLGVLFLVGCESNIQRPTYADITFAHKAPIMVDVAEIIIRSDFKKTYAAPNVEHELPVDLQAITESWARDRLKATGSEGSLTFTILDASVIEENLVKTDGITGVFTTDQSEKYESHISVRIDATHPMGGRMANTSAEVGRSQTVAEDATLNEREAIWYGMAEKMAADLDRQLDENINTYLGDFVLN